MRIVVVELAVGAMSGQQQRVHPLTTTKGRDRLFSQAAREVKAHEDCVNLLRDVVVAKTARATEARLVCCLFSFCFFQ